MNTKYTVGDR